MMVSIVRALTAVIVVAVKLAGTQTIMKGLQIFIDSGCCNGPKMRPGNTKYSSETPHFNSRLAIGATNRTVPATTVSFKMSIGIRGINAVEL